MTNALDELETKLRTHPEVAYERSADRIVVKPVDSSGFEITLVARGDAYAVFFEGWHEEFGSPLEALSCIAFGLGARCRLAVTYRGESPVAWTIESWDGESWREDSTTGLLLVPFWRKRRVVYKQNRVASVVEAEERAEA